MRAACARGAGAARTFYHQYVRSPQAKPHCTHRQSAVLPGDRAEATEGSGAVSPQFADVRLYRTAPAEILAPLLSLQTSEGQLNRSDPLVDYGFFSGGESV